MKKFSIRNAGRSLFLCLFALGFVALSAGEARADEVFIAGFTDGCFGAGCTPNITDNIPGLTYSNSRFSGTTANGFRGLGGNPNPGANVNNLGSFSLSFPPATFDTTFTLLVTFTAPEGILNGANPATFTANVTGTVRSNDDGGVFIDFDNTPRLFTFNDTNCGASSLPLLGQQTTCGSGSFVFTVNDLAVDPEQTASVTGQITGAQQNPIPEPMTMILFGTGLTGVAAAARRRRRAGR